METLAAGQNLNDPKIKNQVAAQVIPLIEDLPNPLERDTYRQALARMLRVDERSLIGAQPRGPLMRRKPRAAGSAPQVEMTISPVQPGMKIESHCLGVLFHKPELLYRVDRKLEEFGLSPLAAEDFEYTDHQLLFGVLRRAVEQDEKDHRHYLASHLPETLSALSQELLAQSEKLEETEDKLLDELVARFVDLRRAHAMTNINQLRFLQEDAQEQGGTNIKPYQEQALQFTRLLRSLDQAKRKASSRR
jgi:DNA primase